LEAHLEDTGRLAATFSGKWGAFGFGFLAGLWHDLGKYAPDWQAFLLEAGQEAPVLGEEQPADSTGRRRRGPDHSTAGAIHAARNLGEKSWAGLTIQFVIAAHHAGLSDRPDLRDRLTNPTKQTRYEASAAEAPPNILSPTENPAFPAFVATPGPAEAKMRQLEVFTRMIFSALVDADYLDTERFFEAANSEPPPNPPRRSAWRGLHDYLPLLEQHLGRLISRVAVTSINEQRNRILGWCRDAAQGPRGVYTLTVPTGGGKTLSGLTFALHHALRHRLERIIVALPFLSILDQTADVFREVFEPLGAPLLVEDHSAILPDHDTMANRLAAENWDAPLVVTTQVQLFESLFASRPRSCRKLHNLANSLVILDEVQTLPVGLVTPILDQLRELSSHYGASLLLTTATQPSLHSRQLGPKAFAGFEPTPREIVPAAAASELFDAFRRVRVAWPDDETPIPWEQLAAKLTEYPQALAIVHRRKDAATLWRLVDHSVGDTLHLSALMCPAHRRDVLREVRSRLLGNHPCRVVSTQLVEAGVDVDFPVVYRAMAGLESLAQAAGRCNREGRLPAGLFVVFNPTTEPPGLLTQHRDIARVMLASDPILDLMQPSTFTAYFDRLYGARSTDAYGIQPLREGLAFDSVAAKFRMIDDSGITIFVPYGQSGRKAIDDLRRYGPSRDRFRDLQAFGVSVYPQSLAKLRAAGRIEVMHDSIFTLVSERDYDPDLGLLTDPEPFEAIFA
jgi:CRISPR-associated endonuclease/helicase Cas3